MKLFRLNLGSTLLSRILTRDTHHARDDSVEYRRLFKLCQSPIEQAFFSAGWGRLTMLGVFTPQTTIGPYTADFTMTRIKQSPLLKIVIECDGWEYHSSQDQQTHDRRRDRTMSIGGWQVVRFTGQEINYDPGADMCVLVLEDMIRNWARLYRRMRRDEIRYNNSQYLCQIDFNKNIIAPITNE